MTVQPVHLVGVSANVICGTWPRPRSEHVHKFWGVCNTKICGHKVRNSCGLDLGIVTWCSLLCDQTCAKFEADTTYHSRVTTTIFYWPPALKVPTVKLFWGEMGQISNFVFLTPIFPDHPRRYSHLKFCMRGWVREIVSPIDLAHSLYNSLYNCMSHGSLKQN